MEGELISSSEADDVSGDTAEGEVSDSELKSHRNDCNSSFFDS
jgi:hypothetical protein